jgi:leucyl-tRNA synthetase
LFYEGQDLLEEKPKYYLLAEFPYPSGPGMHMGHTRNYSMMDAVARLRRMLGYNVMYPIGWDAFGLPTENYAIKVKRPPQEITKENTENFTKQLKSLGLSFDWSREINTADPEYYRWTQWIFLKLHEKGLAYKEEMPINWCPKCKVGCANEEVVDGKHERCDTEVEKRNISQWVLKITEYADRLTDELDLTDYVEGVKARQRNWIGRKEWYDIDYKIEGTDEIVKVSTTRPDTQFGASFVVVAPEHEVLQRLMDKMPEENRTTVEKYITDALKKTDLERISEDKGKTGAFTGLYCINSISEKRLPIYAADFVLSTVGTGMVVGVPAHDKRDFEFAEIFDLPVIRVIEGPNGDRSEITDASKVFTDDGIVYDSGFISGLTSQEAMDKVAEYIEEKGIGKKTLRYHLRDWIFSRQHYWGEPIPIIHCDKCGQVPVPQEELPLVLPKVESFEPMDTGESPLAAINDWVNTTCPKCGGPAQRETDTMPNWAGSSWYYIRYVDANNSDMFADMDKMKYWLPVDHYEGGSEHVTLHLLYSRFWHKVLNDLGLVPGKEPYQIRTIHGVVAGEDGAKMSKSRGNIINPDDLVDEFGADVTRTYMMFMGPYEGDVSWNSDSINGVSRFVAKYYEFILNKWNNAVEKSGEKESKAVARLLEKVKADILDFKFNTSISALMEFYNEFNRVGEFDKKNIEHLIVAIAPAMPHLAEELWSETGHEYSVHMQEWPKFEESLLKDDEIEVPVQINGKIRGRITIAVDSKEDAIKEIVLKDKAFEGYLSDSKIKKFIYVPGRIVTIVI